MICFPNAKINIGLNVISKRNDGYHNIESIFYPVNICDVLEIVENKNYKNGTATIHCSGIKVEGETENNLCIKAFKRIAIDFNLPATDIYLHKIIPMGAGLGGGSADAAFLITMLNTKFNLGLDKNRMNSYASEIGSDCPFFISNKVALAKGRGELLTEISLSLAGYKIWIIKPDVHINTKLAYAMLTPRAAKYSLADITKNEPIDNWKGFIINDFETPVFEKHPEIKKIKDFLYESGALYASMTGSGSAVYGIFRDLPEETALPFNTIFSQKSTLD